MEMKIDSGSDINVLTEEQWMELKQQCQDETAIVFELTNVGVTATAYGSDNPLVITHSFRAWIETTEAVKPRSWAEFSVVKGGTKALLGRRTATKMRLLLCGLDVCEIATHDKASEFPSIPNLEIDFEVDDSVKPVQQSTLNVPLHLRDNATRQIHELWNKGIVEKVYKNATWISRIVMVPKGDGFRLVVDMREPNKAIKRKYFPMPRIEDLKSALEGANIFTKLVLKSAYHHMRLTEKARGMTAFWAPDGVYRFTRLPFGVNCAPEIFQNTMQTLLQGIRNVIVYLDDILVYATSVEELREITTEVIKTLKANNLTLNNEKCEYERSELLFLGHRLSADGLAMDEKKLEAVMSFRPPRNTTELRSFIGVATYLKAFVPKFSEVAKPLMTLMGSAEFRWTEEEENAFIKLKNLIAQSTTNKQGYFRSDHDTFLYTDASPVALGAALVQRDKEGCYHVISFASKVLTKTEQNYPQTQKEALAIVWAMEYFEYYLLGHFFTLRTDAAGIAAIYKQGEARKAKRVMTRAEGWAMKCNVFDYRVERIPGGQNIADASSRLCELKENQNLNKERQRWCEVASLEAGDEVDFEEGHLTKTEVASASGNDEELQKVWVAWQSGQWDDAPKAFKAIRERLTWNEKLLLKEDLIVIPFQLRAKAMSLAHKGHPGMTKMKSLLAERVWWPQLMDDVKRWVENCKSCILTGKGEPPVPMCRTELPQSPWDFLAIDFKGPYEKILRGGYVVVIMDYYSRYMVARHIRATDFKSVQAFLEEVFYVFGYPMRMKCDNGPPFFGKEWKKFCANRDIEIVNSWPLDPKQNGMVENIMRSIEKILCIAEYERAEPLEYLSQKVESHNMSVHSTTHKVPNEIMFGRRLRRSLPIHGSVKVAINDAEIRDTDWANKLKAKDREDKRRGARESRIQVGDMVVVERDNRKKGETKFRHEDWKVTSRRDGDLTMMNDDGVELRRAITKVRMVPEGSAAAVSTGKSVQQPEVNQERPHRSVKRPARFMD